MATIIEDGLWTLTEAAAEHLVEQGIIYKCIGVHITPSLRASDYPIYHLNAKAPREIGVSNLHTYIADAEKIVEVRQ